MGLAVFVSDRIAVTEASARAGGPLRGKTGLWLKWG